MKLGAKDHFNIKKTLCSVLLAGCFGIAVVSAFSGCDNGTGSHYHPVISTTMPGTVAPDGTGSPVPTNNVVISTAEPVLPGNTEPPVIDREISFKDPYLENVIREALGKTVGNIYESDVARITSLTARVRGIRSIEDLKYFTALEELDLYGNKICDLSPLSSLTGLKKLNISGNYSALLDKTGGTGMSLKPLSSLIMLQRLEAESNGIMDLTPLASLINMEYLNVRSNSVSNLNGLEQMTKLKELQAGQNKITDASVLANCVSLEVLGLESNCFYVQDELGEYSFVGLGDISFAQELHFLKSIDVSSNIVSSLDALANAENIEVINATSNHVTDIEALRGSYVKKLFLEANFITSFDAIESMPFLNELGFYGNPIEDSAAIEIFVFKQNNPGATLPPELAGENNTESNGEEEPGDI